MDVILSVAKNLFPEKEGAEILRLRLRMTGAAE